MGRQQGPALKQWKRQVQAHHAQSRRAMKEEARDYWQPYTSFFRQDPYRTGDPALNALLRHVRPSDTVLDVGGGAGRFALPLALRCRWVTVVEPSPSMVAALKEGMQEAGITNISVFQSLWEEAEVEPHDVVLCAHVLYGVEEVDAFVKKLLAHARRLVLVLMFMESPISVFSQAWRLVRRERRIDLPGLRLLLPVLWEMDIYPDVEMVQCAPYRAFPSWEAAVQELRRRLYISPQTPEEERLMHLLPRLLEETPEGIRLRCTPSRWEGLLVLPRERATPPS